MVPKYIVRNELFEYLYYRFRMNIVIFPKFPQ